MQPPQEPSGYTPYQGEVLAVEENLYGLLSKRGLEVMTQEQKLMGTKKKVVTEIQAACKDVKLSKPLTGIYDSVCAGFLTLNTVHDAYVLSWLFVLRSRNPRPRTMNVLSS
jgi:hypothetical protein